MVKSSKEASSRTYQSNSSQESKESKADKRELLSPEQTQGRLRLPQLDKHRADKGAKQETQEHSKPGNKEHIKEGAGVHSKLGPKELNKKGEGTQEKEVARKQNKKETREQRMIGEEKKTNIKLEEEDSESLGSSNHRRRRKLQRSQVQVMLQKEKGANSLGKIIEEKVNKKPTGFKPRPPFSKIRKETTTATIKREDVKQEKKKASVPIMPAFLMNQSHKPRKTHKFKPRLPALDIKKETTTALIERKDTTPERKKVSAPIIPAFLIEKQNSFFERSFPQPHMPNMKEINKTKNIKTHVFLDNPIKGPIIERTAEKPLIEPSYSPSSTPLSLFRLITTSIPPTTEESSQTPTADSQRADVTTIEGEVDETTMAAPEQPVEETVTKQELETTERPETQGANNDPSEGGETVLPGIIQEQEVAFGSVKEETPSRTIAEREENIKVLEQNIHDLNNEIATIIERVEERQMDQTFAYQTTPQESKEATEEPETTMQPYTEQSVSISKSISSSSSSSSSSASLQEDGNFKKNSVTVDSKSDKFDEPHSLSDHHITTDSAKKETGANGIRKKESTMPIRIKAKERSKHKRKVEPYEYPLMTSYPENQKDMKSETKSDNPTSTSTFSSVSSTSHSSSSSSPSSFPPTPSTSSFAPEEVTTVIYAIPYVTESPNYLVNNVQTTVTTRQHDQKIRKFPSRSIRVNNFNMTPFVML